MIHPKILISGATGTNGVALIQQFVQHQIPVRALVRNADRATPLINEYVEIIEGDLADPDSLTKAFHGIEKAYIVTAVEKDAPVWFDNFYAAAKSAGVKHLLKFSGMGAEPESKSEIIRQHYISDKALIDSGLTYSIIRPNSFHQNMLWQSEPIKTQRQFYLPMADAKQSFVDVRDLAEASFKILTEDGHQNKIYTLTGSESLSMQDVAESLSDAIGETVTYVAVPLEAAKQSMLDAGMPEWNAAAVAELQGVFATGLYKDVSKDLATILGREPRTFKQFAVDFVSAFK